MVTIYQFKVFIKRVSSRGAVVIVHWRLILFGFGIFGLCVVRRFPTRFFPSLCVCEWLYYAVHRAGGLLSMLGVQLWSGSIAQPCAAEYVEYVYGRRHVYSGGCLVHVTVIVTDARRPRRTLLLLLLLLLEIIQHESLSNLHHEWRLPRLTA